MDDRDVIDFLIGELLRPRLGHVPRVWPGRLYDRIDRTARAAKLEPSAFLRQLLDTPDPKNLEALIDAATIGHTSFFRHPDQFDRLRSELRRLAAKKSDPVRIWCVACSTGEEAYSIGLAALRARVSVDVLGTDVNAAAIRTARAGQYAGTRAGAVPEGVKDSEWSASGALRKVVRFEVASLVSNDPAGENGSFDIIFCRNVLIYFDRRDVPAVLEKLAGRLRPNGFIVLSPVDALLPLPDCLTRDGAVGWLVPCDQDPSSRTGGSSPPSRRRRRSSSAPPPPPARVSAARTVPPPSDSLLDSAARLLGSGQGEKAESLLGELLDANPDHLAGWFLLGEALLQRGEPAQARAAFARAARCSPEQDAGVDGDALKSAAARRVLALDG